MWKRMSFSVGVHNNRFAVEACNLLSGLQMTPKVFLKVMEKSWK